MIKPSPHTTGFKILSEILLFVNLSTNKKSKVATVDIKIFLKKSTPKIKAVKKTTLKVTIPPAIKPSKVLFGMYFEFFDSFILPINFPTNAAEASATVAIKVTLISTGRSVNKKGTNANAIGIVPVKVPHSSFLIALLNHFRPQIGSIS